MHQLEFEVYTTLDGWRSPPWRVVIDQQTWLDVLLATAREQREYELARKDLEILRLRRELDRLRHRRWWQKVLGLGRVKP